MTDMEDRLFEDKSGFFLKKLSETLLRESLVTKRRLDAKTRPDEFARLSRYASALDAALDVANKVWSEIHENPGGRNL
ncbi:MAG: hypothetical protein HQK54_10520 [Oligoflexales bacterium]|nr:hypothetical protein [Oligoflexales bacterium]